MWKLIHKVRDGLEKWSSSKYSTSHCVYMLLKYSSGHSVGAWGGGGWNASLQS